MFTEKSVADFFPPSILDEWIRLDLIAAIDFVRANPIPNTRILKYPDFRLGRKGRWELYQAPDCLLLGFFSGLNVVASDDLFVLKKKERSEKWRTWMSTGPLELESQAIPLFHAKGHVVVMGLGMGIVAYNYCLMDNVEKVTVVERDPQIIDLFSKITDRDTWDERVIRKLNIINSDALKVNNNGIGRVELLYPDIWPWLGDDNALRHTKLMCNNLKPELCYYWGQEFDLLDYYRVRRISTREPRIITPEALAAYDQYMRQENGIPSFLSEVKDFPRLFGRCMVISAASKGLGDNDIRYNAATGKMTLASRLLKSK